MPRYCRQRLTVRGVVQGVGFRPYVYHLAKRLGLTGRVFNDSVGVIIEIEGLRQRIRQFRETLIREAPQLARIDAMESEWVAPQSSVDFCIVESAATVISDTSVLADVATCDECMREVRDPADRRYRYPFSNCTNCGPRYTIVRGMPYDRARTTMDAFPMCPDCAREYHDPSDRRFHAQPNACPACGPTVWFVECNGSGTREPFRAPSGPVGEAAIDVFHRGIESGWIIATKGVGGFHLVCAADNTPAIARLRRGKGRVDKPLAVMVVDVEAARRLAYVSPEAEQVLQGRERPIVLLTRRANGQLSPEIAPGNRQLGIMLPYSPLHAMLVERCALVMTSGNVSEEPIARTGVEAFERLSALVDGFLLHDREIIATCDDSVVRTADRQTVITRRARGYAPLPLRMAESLPSVLAVGGDLKAVFCMTRGTAAYLSPHIGDLQNLETLRAFEAAVDHFARLFQLNPEAIICDMHPGYLSRDWARRRAMSNGVVLIEVQHHHAHIAAVLAEHDWPATQRVIGVAFDGTGYGADKAIWGGEVLVASRRDYVRCGHLKYGLLPGGDSAVRRPYRTAMAHLWTSDLPWDDSLPCVAACSATEHKLLRRQLERRLNCVTCSSMGRLFDAVASLIGVRQTVSYEGQAAIEMESLSHDVEAAKPYPYRTTTVNQYQIDPAPMFRKIVNDMQLGVAASVIIDRFFATVVDIVVAACEHARSDFQLDTVALSGGVFQNVVLLEQVTKRLRSRQFTVLTHRFAPPNDGGLALGQAVVGAARLNHGDEPITLQDG